MAVDDLLLTATIGTVQQAPDKRLRLSWSRKTVPLKNSLLFNKSKHSQEWRENVEATAGVLHPSDAKFPYGFLRNHTDVYLRKKGKLSQADTDLRLAILVETHDAKDIAVAAAAHAITAKSLRTMLLADLNVAQGNYWGLDVWLQSLIAANEGNPASVTDLEASWARLLLPYTSVGACAPGLLLKGVCRALTKSRIPNLNLLPEYLVLIQRAVVDFSAELEGYRLRCDWVAAHKAIFWMVELDIRATGMGNAGSGLLEQELDWYFPAWRVWAAWRPDMERINRLSGMDSTSLATIFDVASLEGPDMIAGTCRTLREGLATRSQGGRSWTRYKGLIIEFPEASLPKALDRIMTALDNFLIHKVEGDSLFLLFRSLTICQPITMESLDVLEAIMEVEYTVENHIYNTVREVYSNRMSLGGQHIVSLQCLIRTLELPQAEKLRKLLGQYWLSNGIEKCLKECQDIVQTHIDASLPWLSLALELHNLGICLRSSELMETMLNTETVAALFKGPTQSQMRALADIHRTAQAHQQTFKATPSMSTKAPQSNDNSGTSLAKASQQTKHPLEPIIEEFCAHYLLGSSKISTSTQRTISALIFIWTPTESHHIDCDRRSLAVLVSKHAAHDQDLREACLSEIASSTSLLESPTLLKDLLTILIRRETQPDHCIISLTQLLTKSTVTTKCWTDLLHAWLLQASTFTAQPSSFLSRTLDSLNAADWLCLMSSLELLFASREAPRCIPWLTPKLLSWNAKVFRFTATITRLENALGKSEAVRCILRCGEGFWHKNLLSILACLEKAEGKGVEELMQKVVGMLRAKGKTHWEVKECVWALVTAREEEVEMYEKIWDAAHGVLEIPGLPASDEVAETAGQISSNRGPAQDATSKQKHTVPVAVAEVMVAGYLQSMDTSILQSQGIEALARVLNLTIFKDTIPQEKLLEATVFWDNISASLIAEAERLTQVTKALKAKDPSGTTLLLRELRVPDYSALDEALSKLPARVIDVVERLGDSEVEMSFSLSAWTELKRSAMGISATASALLLRLSFDNMGVMEQTFCLHLNDEAGLKAVNHVPWDSSEDTLKAQVGVCSLSTRTAFMWQCHRILHTQLKLGNIGIESLHRLIKTRLDGLGQACIVCGTSHNAHNTQLRRSTPCDLLACTRLWYQLPLEIRVPELKTDTFAVDMLLTSVYAAALSGRPELLPNCPIRSAEAVKAVLNALPSVTFMSHAVNLSPVLRSYHVDAEKLISWACVHFRGFLTTAPSLCKIPNLPKGTHQFVLANASPVLEAGFAARIPKVGTKTTVLFHGTSFDRLPAILSQGLKNCSGTALQRIGAAHGKGVYLADEPATSFTYSAGSLSWRNSGLGNMRLMLGCEVAGVGRSVSPGIHVVTDERTVMVRYLFLFTNEAIVPTAAQIVPAMASGMAALRSGAV